MKRIFRRAQTDPQNGSIGFLRLYKKRWPRRTRNLRREIDLFVEKLASEQRIAEEDAIRAHTLRLAIESRSEHRLRHIQSLDEAGYENVLLPTLQELAGRAASWPKSQATFGLKVLSSIFKKKMLGEEKESHLGP